MNPTKLERAATIAFLALAMLALGFAFFFLFIRSQL